MSLTNIAALFSDIVETPQQRQQRLLAEGPASAGQFTGLPGRSIPKPIKRIRFAN